MHHLRFWRLPSKPDFPGREDLPLLSDYDAMEALTELRSLVDRDLADVYTRPYPAPGERPGWNVWLDARLVRGGLRIDLQEWAERRHEWTAE
jgi:hypothetical protein